MLYKILPSPRFRKPNPELSDESIPKKEWTISAAKSDTAAFYPGPDETFSNIDANLPDIDANWSGINANRPGINATWLATDANRIAKASWHPAASPSNPGSGT